MLIIRATLVAALASLAACGGGDDESDDSATALRFCLDPQSFEATIACLGVGCCPPGTFEKLAN